jgi:hypothetical protein
MGNSLPVLDQSGRVTPDAGQHFATTGQHNSVPRGARYLDCARSRVFPLHGDDGIVAFITDSRHGGGCGCEPQAVSERDDRFGTGRRDATGWLATWSAR